MGELTVCANPSCEIQFAPRVHNQKYCSPECKNESRRRQFTHDVAEAVAPAYMENDEEQFEYLRKEIIRLQRENKKLKHVGTEVAASVDRVVKEYISELSYDPVPAPHFKKSAGGTEIAVAMLSDLQLAKVTPSYNTAVCEQRIQLYRDKIAHITELHRSHHNVDELHIWMLGDIIEGMGIFPGQQFLVDSGFYRQVIIDGPRILGDFIRSMLTIFRKVHVVGVIGNHGRISNRNEFDPESNGDRMLYKVLEYIFDHEPRVTFNIPDGPGERNWYAIDAIGNYRSMLIHGDQFNGFNSIPLISRKVLGWKAGAVEEDWDDLALGHFHQSFKITIGNTTVRVNGTTESNNTWAQELFASMGSPSQHLMYVDPVDGRVAAEYDIYLS